MEPLQTQFVFDQIKNHKKTVILKWFFMITLVSSLLGYVTWMILPIENWNYLFSDFAEVLSYCAVKNPYDGSNGITAIYPPISYLIFLPFLIFCYRDVQDRLAGNVNLQLFYQRPMFVVAYIIYFVLTLTLILLVIAKMSKLKGKNLFYLLGTIIFSGPLYFIFMRGNIILTTFLFVLIFFWLYQSEKRWQRELSLVCLAMAIAMKIYPVLLVLVLLQQRRWLDIVKTGVYSIILVFLPFVFVSGNMFNNINWIFASYANLVSREFGFTIISLTGVFSSLANLISQNCGVDMMQEIGILANILKYALIVISVVTLLLCYRSTRKFEIAAVAIGCYAFFPNGSYAYVLVFTLILLILLLNSFETYHKKDLILNSLLLLVIFFSLPYFLYFCLMQFFALLILVVKSIVTLLTEYFRAMKNERRTLK